MPVTDDLVPTASAESHSQHHFPWTETTGSNSNNGHCGAVAKPSHTAAAAAPPPPPTTTENKTRFVGKHSKDQKLSIFIQKRNINEHQASGEVEEILGLVRISPEAYQSITQNGSAGKQALNA